MVIEKLCQEDGDRKESETLPVCCAMLACCTSESLHVCTPTVFSPLTNLSIIFDKIFEFSVSAQHDKEHIE